MCKIENDCECLFENYRFYDCNKIAGDMIVDENRVYDEDMHVAELKEVFK